jgi:hypothetical protein
MTVRIPEELGAFWLLRRGDTNSFSRVSFAWLGLLSGGWVFAWRDSWVLARPIKDDELMMVAMMMSRLYHISQFLH